MSFASTETQAGNKEDTVLTGGPQWKEAARLFGLGTPKKEEMLVSYILAQKLQLWARPSLQTCFAWPTLLKKLYIRCFHIIFERVDSKGLTFS